jgi:phenylpyruvate tautomerase PptA (4-oxalocrotonate tautomerase family)
MKTNKLHLSFGTAYYFNTTDKDAVKRALIKAIKIAITRNFGSELKSVYVIPETPTDEFSLGGEK